MAIKARQIYIPSAKVRQISNTRIKARQIYLPGAKVREKG